MHSGSSPGQSFIIEKGNYQEMTQCPKAEKVSATKVTVNIRIGPASPGQRQAWNHFWKELIYEVKAGDKKRTVNWNRAGFENETSP